MNKKYGFAAMFVVVLALSVSSAVALPSGSLYRNDSDGFNLGDTNSERESLRTAVENNDYSSWKGIMEEIINKMKSMVSKENFDKVAARHNSMNLNRFEKESLRNITVLGNYSIWREHMEAQLTEEKFYRFVNISTGDHSVGKMMGVPFNSGFFMNFSEEQLAEIKLAIKNSDYLTWKLLIESQLTEDNFNSFIQMHSKMDERRVGTMRKHSS